MRYHVRVPVPTITEGEEVQLPTWGQIANPYSQVQVDRPDQTTQPITPTTIHAQTPPIENHQHPHHPS